MLSYIQHAYGGIFLQLYMGPQKHTLYTGVRLLKKAH